MLFRWCISPRTEPWGGDVHVAYVKEPLELWSEFWQVSTDPCCPLTCPQCGTMEKTLYRLLGACSGLPLSSLEWRTIPAFARKTRAGPICPPPAVLLPSLEELYWKHFCNQRLNRYLWLTVVYPPNMTGATWKTFKTILNKKGKLPILHHPLFIIILCILFIHILCTLQNNFLWRLIQPLASLALFHVIVWPNLWPFLRANKSKLFSLNDCLP